MENNYKSLEAYWNNRRDKKQDKRKILNNTWVKKGKFVFPLTGEVINDTMIIQLHNSDIIGYLDNEKEIMLNSDGYKTHTTKDRINYFLPDNYRLYQENNVWYLWHDKINYPFQDGITINLTDNEVYFYKDISELKNEKTLIKQVKKYAAQYARLFVSGKLDKPDGGDCWNCYMNFPDNDNDHLLSHLEESYYVPSLLIKALNWNSGYISQITGSFIHNLWYTEKPEDYQVFNDIAYNQIKKTIEKYMLTFLNLVR